MSWRNWAGNQRAVPQAVRHPRGADQIAAAITAAASAGQRVKAIGAGHSFTGVGVTDGVQLVLDRHDQLLSADPDTGLVRVQAGMTIRQLSAQLADHGLALTNLGDIDVQTVSGAINTGTHGTGLRFGGLATQVRELTLVLADGSVLTCSGQQQPELFAAALVGLGAFGVVESYLLQTEPAFALAAVEGPARFAELVEGRFAELVEGVDHAEFFWFPHTDRCLLKCNTRLPLDQLDPLPRWRRVLDDQLLANTAFGLTCRLGAAVPALVPAINQLAGRALSGRRYVAASHQVFTSPRRVRFVEMEYALPLAQLPAVLTELRAFLDRSGLRVSFPVEVRVAAADEVWLSTAYQRSSAYVAVHMFRGQPYRPYFRGVEAILTQAGGRPHWGKLHEQDAASLAALYPRFAAAVALRDRLDPERRFANPYLDRVLG